MKKFLEEYGFTILAAIVVILLIAMATPVGNTVKEQVIHVVQRFSRTADKKLQSDNGDVSVTLSKDLKLNIITKSSTDKFDYIVHYINRGNELSSTKRSYDDGFIILENCDAGSEIYVEVIDLGTNSHYYSNVVKNKDKHIGMNENQVSYIVRHHWQNLEDDNYTLHEAETRIIEKGQELDLSLTKKTYEGFDFINSKINENITTTITPTDSGFVVDNYYDRQLFYLDFNLRIDEEWNVHPVDQVKFDLKINGKQVRVEAGDYYQEHRYGSTYEFYNIKALPGYINTGKLINTSSPLKGVITKWTTVTALFSTEKEAN